MRTTLILVMLLALILTGVVASQVQSPRPQPVPLPDREPEQKPPSPENDQPSKKPPGPNADQPSSRTFTGKILKTGQKYRLQEKATKATYDLEQQEKAQPYEGELVTISGVLDARHTIHIETIEPAD